MNENLELIVSAPVLSEPEISQASITIRDALVSYAASLTLPHDAESAQHCAEVGGRLQKLIKSAEDMEAELRAPVNGWLKRLRERLNEYLSSVKEQKQRLADGYAAFQASERQRVEAEKAAREAEIRAAQLAMDKAQIEAHEAGKAMQSEDELSAALEAEKQAKEREEQLRQAVLYQPKAVKAGGASSKTEVCFEVIDAIALYNATKNDQGFSPFVKLEPNRAALKASISKDTRLPGLKVWTEEKATFRSAGL